jgi:HK97 family phage major capsid protein
MDINELKTEVKQAVEPVMTAFEEFKKTNDARIAEVEKKGAVDPVLTEKLGKIEASLAAHEGLNQKLLLAEKQQKALEEKQGAFDALLAKLESKMGRPGALSAQERQIELKKRVNLWTAGVVGIYTKGLPNLSEGEQKALSDVAAEYKALNIGTDTAGGYLAPTEYVAEIIKSVTLSSPARGLVRVRQTANKSIQIPKRTGQFAARRTTEQGTRSETTGLTYGLEELAVPEMYALIDISNQMLEDSAFDMEAEIRMESSEQFAVKEGAEFVSGTGIGECEGILTNGSVAETVSGSAATIADSTGQADGLLTLKHAIKSAYARNATWVLNRTTIGAVRKLKDTNKQYIWMPGVQNGAPNTIDGDPYAEFPDMPSEGANLYPVAYGDFNLAYTLVDRVAMEMLRDPYTQATSGNIRFIFRRRVGGKVVLAEAIRKLKCST